MHISRLLVAIQQPACGQFETGKTLAGFHINACSRCQPAMQLQQLTTLLMQIGCKRRVQQHQVKLLCGRLRQPAHCILLDHLQLVGAKQAGIRPQCSSGSSIGFQRSHGSGAARECFKAQRATAGEQVEAAHAYHAELQPVEQGFAHAVGRGTQVGGVGELQHTAAPFAANDADAVAFVVGMRHVK